MPYRVLIKEYSIWNIEKIQGAILVVRRHIVVVRRPKVDLVAIGSRIRALRGEGLQEELAAYLHIRQGNLSKIERGRSAPSLDILLQLSERFHRSVDWILRGEGE